MDILQSAEKAPHAVVNVCHPAEMSVAGEVTVVGTAWVIHAVTENIAFIICIMSRKAYEWFRPSKQI